jgi:hypothetical protein
MRMEPFDNPVSSDQWQVHHSMGSDLCLCGMRVGAEWSPQVSTSLEIKSRFKHGHTSVLCPWGFSLLWSTFQVPIKSCPLQSTDKFLVVQNQSSHVYCHSSLVQTILFQVLPVAVNSTALPEFIQALQISSLTLVGSCSLWSGYSHILGVPHGNIQAGYVCVVRVVLEFIKDQEKELQRPWCK